MKKELKRRGSLPGENNGGGRKKSAVELVPFNRDIYKGQAVSSHQLRQTLTIGERIVDALGSPHFDSEQIFVALNGVPSNGSLSALLNILPDLEKFGKDFYKE
jgi:hypothetical protein